MKEIFSKKPAESVIWHHLVPKTQSQVLGLILYFPDDCYSQIQVREQLGRLDSP